MDFFGANWVMTMRFMANSLGIGYHTMGIQIVIWHKFVTTFFPVAPFTNVV